MAIKYYERYPQRWESPSQDYPQGAFKNLSALGEQDGSYLEASWLNDQSGFFGALLRNAEMTPNGLVDTAQKSQFYDALIKVARNIVAENPIDLSPYFKKADIAQEWGDSPDKVLSQEFLSGYNIFRTVYVSTSGDDTNDGSAGTPFKTIQRAVDSRAATIKIAAGSYVEDVKIASLNNKYILTLDFEEGAVLTSTTSYPIHIVENSNVWIKNGVVDANNSQYAVLVEVGSRVLLDGGSYKGATRAVVYCSNGSRVRWGNGVVLDGEGVCRECVSIYNHSSGGVYGTNRNTFKNSEIGVEVSGSSYSHTDFIDFIDVTYGITSVHQSHTTNYDNSFTNCTIGWQARGYSTINTARVLSMVNVRTRSRVLNEIIGLDAEFNVSQNYQQFYPALGNGGRQAIGYNEITLPFGTFQYSMDGVGVDFSLSGFSGSNFIIDNGSLVIAQKNNSRIVFTSTGAADYSFNLLGNQFVLREQNQNILMFSKERLRPSTEMDLGNLTGTFKDIYLTNNPTVVSDKRAKFDINDIDDKYMRVMSRLKFKEFKLKAGASGRTHFGIIAQEWIEACEDEGVDPKESGVLAGDEESGYAIRYNELQILFNAYVMQKISMLQ